MNGNGRLFFLILLLLVTLTMLTTDRQIIKVSNYSESVEEAVDIVGSQAGKLHKDIVSASQVWSGQINELDKKYWHAMTEIGALKAKLRRERSEMNALLGIDGKYDKNNILVSEKHLGNFIDHKVYARVAFQMVPPEGMPDTELDDAVVAPPAIIIGKYVLMASHVSSIKEVEKRAQLTLQIMTPNGPMTATFQYRVLGFKAVISLNGREYALEEKYRNEKKDFALFEITENPGINFPFGIGRSSELKIGDFVYINGRPSAIPLEVARPGHVTALTSLDYNGEGPRADDSEFGVSMVATSGDSGSPIIAFRDGKPELVGIYLGWIGERDDIRSRALRIDSAIDEIKEKLGIDLREIQKQTLSK